MTERLVSDALENQRWTTELGLDVQRLNVLDDIWTGYLAARHERADIERDFPVLRGLAADMIVLLERVAAGSARLRHLLPEIPVDLDQELSMVLEGQPLGSWFQEMRPEAPFAAQVAGACEIVERDVPAAIAEIAGKLERLAQGVHEPGDLPGLLKCAVLLVGAGASLVGLIVAPAHPVAGIVVGGVGLLLQTLASAAGWNCRRAGDSATAAA